MSKHSYKPGMVVTYRKLAKCHPGCVNIIEARVIRVSRSRVVVQDVSGKKHFVKPSNLSRR